MTAKHNLAHRMGRWSGMHPWTAILGWMAFVVVSFVIGNTVFTPHVLTDAELGVGESGRAALVLDHAFPTSRTPATEMILVQTRSGRLATADLSAVARDIRSRVGGVPAVTHLQPPERSADGRAALIRFDIRGDSTKAGDKVAPIQTAVAAVAGLTQGCASRSSATHRPARRSTTSWRRTSRRRSSSRCRSRCSSCCSHSARCSRPASRSCSA